MYNPVEMGAGSGTKKRVKSGVSQRRQAVHRARALIGPEAADGMSSKPRYHLQQQETRGELRPIWKIIDSQTGRARETFTAHDGFLRSSKEKREGTPRATRAAARKRLGELNRAAKTMTGQLRREEEVQEELRSVERVEF